MQPVTTQEDRTMSVPPGQVVRTAYVEVHRVQMACRDRMAVGDVERSYRRLLQMQGQQPWPPPVGQWQGEWFVISDGRHQYVASLMLGYSHVLVAWLSDGTEP